MTQSELEAFEARRAAKRPQIGVQPAGKTWLPGMEPTADPEKAALAGEEAKLQWKIREYCKAQRWICACGSMAHKTMRNPGEPDMYVYLPMGVMMLVECKTRTGKLSAEQVAFHGHAQLLGHAVHVVRSIQDFISTSTQLIKCTKRMQNLNQEEIFGMPDLPPEEPPEIESSS